MSFIRQVQEELAHIIPEKTCCRKAELAAILIANGSTRPEDDGCSLITEVDSAAIARKVFALLKELYGLTPAVETGTRKRFKTVKRYVVSVNLEDIKIFQDLKLINHNLQIKPKSSGKIAGKNCCKRSLARGFFLCRGFVNRPENGYHLELSINDFSMAKDFQKMMLHYSLEFRYIERKNSRILYLKESDQIAEFLKVIAASQAVLEFENVRILKSMRNDVNRQVNCETANLAKTIDAAVRQTELIKKMQYAKGWENMPAHLRELAAIRLEFPELTLKELGSMLNPPLSKPGTAYRMRRIEKYAEKIISSLE